METARVGWVEEPSLQVEMKAKVYIETSVVSYLTARMGRDLIVAGHQQITQKWWDTRKEDFDLYVSQLVVREKQGGGDSDAAQRRLSVLEDIQSLEMNQQVIEGTLKNSRCLCRTRKPRYVSGDQGPRRRNTSGGSARACRTQDRACHTHFATLYRRTVMSSPYPPSGYDPQLVGSPRFLISLSRCAPSALTPAGRSGAYTDSSRCMPASASLAAWPPAISVSRPFSVQSVTAYGSPLRCPRLPALRSGPFPKRRKALLADA